MKAPICLALALAVGADALRFPFIRRAEEACATGLHMIVARGSNEPAGLGKIGVIAGNVSLAIPGSTTAAVDYPAVIEQYASSVAKGMAEVVRMVAEYTKRCPDTKIALLGYSQGAHSVMDTVCGGSSAGFNASSDLSEAFAPSIVAVVTYGDPSHNANASWNLGTSKSSGLFPRLNIDACEPYTDRIKGWCDTGDVYCDKGNNTKIHATYFANYTTVTVDYIVGKYNASIAGKTVNETKPEAGKPTTVGPGSAAGLRSAGAPDAVLVTMVSLGLLAFGSIGL